MIAMIALTSTLAFGVAPPAAPPAAPAATVPAAEAPMTVSQTLRKRLQAVYASMESMTKDFPKDGSATPAQMESLQTKVKALATEALEGVDLTKIDAGAMDAADELCRMAGGTKQAEFVAIVSERAKEPTAEGFAFATAAVGAMPDASTGAAQAEAHSAATLKLLSHPGLHEGFKGMTGSALLQALSECSDDQLHAAAPQILALGEMFTPDAPAPTFGLCVEWVRLVQRAAPDAQFQAARTAVATAAKERLAQATEEPKRKSLTRMVGVLDGAAMRGQLLGYPAPEMEMLWMGRNDGTPAWKTLADLKGKVVVLDFWATWCGPCVGSFPQVRAMRAKYSPEDVEIVGITSPQGYVAHKKRKRVDCKGDVAKEQTELAEFMKDMDMTWTVAMTGQDVFNPDYAIRGIPFVAIIDADGKVAKVGLHPSNEEEITRTIDALVAKRKAGSKG